MSAAGALQARLSGLNQGRFLPGFPGEPAAGRDDLAAEVAFLEEARAAVAERAATAPVDAGNFVLWFEDLARTGPGQGDPLFPWLAEACSLDQMRWFLAQEVAGEAGFEDLTALTQLRMPTRAKLELARNYWDEMGRGGERGMHGPMLERLADHLRLDEVEGPIVWEAHALANTMAGLAANRCYAYHAVGALGVVELTAPGRAGLVDQGLRRLGVSAKFRHYFALHATLDVRHSAAWNAEVIVPLVSEEPRAAVAIAEGALMRLACGAACFARYREEFMQPA